MSQILKVTFEYMKQPVDDYHYMIRENKMLYSQAGELFAKFGSSLSSVLSSCPKQLGSLMSSGTHPSISRGLKAVQYENELLRSALKRIATIMDGLGGRFKESHDELKTQGNEWKNWEKSFTESMNAIQNHYDQGKNEITKAKTMYESYKQKIELIQEKKRLASVDPGQMKAAAQIENSIQSELLVVKKIYDSLADKHKTTNQLISNEVQALMLRIGKCFINSSVFTMKVLQSSIDSIHTLTSSIVDSYPKSMLTGAIKDLRENPLMIRDNNCESYFSCPEVPAFYNSLPLEEVRHKRSYSAHALAIEDNKSRIREESSVALAIPLPPKQSQVSSFLSSTPVIKGKPPRTLTKTHYQPKPTPNQSRSHHKKAASTTSYESDNEEIA